MSGVKVRVTASAGAWLLGAATATGLSLFAVSRLGTVVPGTQGSTLSSQDISRAVASAATSPAPSSSPAGGTGADSPGSKASSAPAAALSSGTQTNSTVSGPAPSSSGPEAPSSSPQGSVTTSGQQTGSSPSAQRRLSVHGGDVVAQCQGVLAYLVSWSPAQGFQTGPVQRGPARYATVVFVDAGPQVPWTIHVSCNNGTPVANYDDDGRGDDH